MTTSDIHEQHGDFPTAIEGPLVPFGGSRRPPLDRRPEEVLLRACSPATARAYKSDLATIARQLGADPENVPWENLRYQHVHAILAGMGGLAPTTRARKLTALKQVAKHARRLGHINRDELDSILEIKIPDHERPLAGRLLTPREVERLIEACDEDATPRGVRDAAMIGLMYLGGLRRAEVAAAMLEDWHPEEDQLIVRGKRNRHEPVEVRNGALLRLEAWLAVRGSGPGPLFYQVAHKGGDLLPEPTTPKAVGRMVQRRAKQARLTNVHSHDLRRALATHLLDANVDVFTVAAVLRHRQLSNTRRYDRRPIEQKRRALDRVHIPAKAD